MNKKSDNIICDYDEYLSILKSGKTDVVFSGEWSVMKVLALYKPQGTFYVWDMLCGKGNTILLKIDLNQNSIHIVQAYELDISPHRISEILCISDESSAIRWWNLCYYLNQEGHVLYDEYYDKLFAANDSDKTMGDFREEIKRCLDIIPEGIAGNNVYLLGDLAAFNPLIYELQNLCCHVIPVSDNEFSESIELNEQLLRLKDELVVPYCKGEILKMDGLTSEGTTEVQAKCNHPYVISIPCDNLDLNAVVLGDNTLKQILPNGEVRKDYKCCGQEYMYLEQTLYADIFGNTFIKSINSGMNPEEDKEKMPCVVLNIFSFSN